MQQKTHSNRSIKYKCSRRVFSDRDDTTPDALENVAVEAAEQADGADGAQWQLSMSMQCRGKSMYHR